MFNFENLNIPLPLLFLLINIWEWFWKAVALWKAAKKGDTLWFVGIFIVNSLGILPIFYLWKTKQLDDVLNMIKSKFKLITLKKN